MTRRWFVAAMAVGLAWAAGMPGCGGGGGSGGGGGDTIKLGSLNSMTGLNSTFGQSSDKGIRLAAEEINAAGGVLGKKIEIVTADTESSPEKATNAVSKLLNQDRVAAVLGEVASSRSLAAAPSCQRAGVPMLSPASTNPQVTQIGDYIFRACFTDDFQGLLIAQFTAENLKFKRAAILWDVKNDYSVGLKDVLKAEFPKRGGQIVGEAQYSAGETNFKTQLTTLKNTNPEIIFLPGYYTEVALIVRQARELGITCPFIGGDGWDSDTTLKNGGQAVEGCYFTNHYAPPPIEPAKRDQALEDKELVGKYGKRTIEFVVKYMKKYNNEIPDAMATLGYDAANIMFDALKRAGSTDGAKLRDALAATKNFPGVTGDITIGPDRNAIKPGVVMTIRNGRFVMLDRVTPKGVATTGTEPAK